MRKALPGPRVAWKVAYVAFSALLTLSAVLYFANIQATAAGPSVSFERVDDDIASPTTSTVTASATPAGSDELKFLRNSGNDQYWNWGIVDEAADCKSGFTVSGQALRSGTDDAVTIEFSPIPTSDQHVCLNVLYGSSGSTQFQQIYSYYLLDTTAPEIEAAQDGLSLTARSSDPSGIETWYHYEDTSGAATDCSSFDGSYTAESPASGNNYYTVTLTSTQNDYAYCFKADDGQGNSGFSDPVVVDTVAPNSLTANQPAESASVTITVSQDDDNDNTPDGNTDIDVDSWQYVQSTRVCSTVSGWRDLDGLTTDLTQDRAVITFRRSAVGRTYCFRVADDAGNYAYVQHQIASINEPPVINSLSQSRQSVIATATDRQYLDDSSWEYAVTDDADCDSSVTGWVGLGGAFSSDDARNRVTLDLSGGNVVDESTANKWLCFRVSDNVADNHGYRSLDVDALAPTISLSQDNAVLRARAPSADRPVSSSWRYVRHTSSFTCDEDAFELYTPIRSGSRVNLVTADVGDYFCFRVADRYDNYGYSDDYRIRSLDTTAPEFTVTQDNKRLDLEAAASENVDHDTWGYYAAGSQTDCEDVHADLYDGVEDRVIDLTESDVGDYFCVRVADDSGNYGYRSIRIRAVDATAPLVEVERDKNTLRASTTAGDVNDNSWQYAVSDANDRFDCDETNNQLRFNAASSANDTVVLDEDDNDKYYCFRVADKAGNHGYGLSEQVYNVEPAPVITIIQHTANKRLEVSTDATDVDGLTWGWATFSTDPGDCSSVRYTNISHSQITTNTRRIFVNNIADSQDGKYYCFRVADTSDVYGTNYGYGKHRYDLGAPSIRFELANNVLTVSSASDDVDAASWAYAKFGQAVDCENETVGQSLPYRKVSLSEADNGSYLCFKVSDKSGNVAYARYQVAGIEDDGIPVINVSQTKYAIIATSADRDIDPATWRYALAPSEPYCDLGHRLALIRNSGALNKVDLTKVSNVYTWVCFEVADRAGNKGFAKIEIDRQAPTISVQQNNVVLEVESADEDLDLRSWAYAKSDSARCDGNVVFTKLDFSSQKVSFDLTAADSGKYFCLRVADKVGNEAHSSVRIDQIDMQAPVIRLSQDGNVLNASAVNIDANSWQYARSGSDINCSAGGNAVFNAASADNSSVALTAADNGHWYCFKVRGSNGAEGYAKVLVNNVDTRAPKVKAVQKGDVVIATASESVASWHHVVMPGGECGPAAFEAAAKVNLGNQAIVDASDDGLVYCFRATDASDNTGYDSVRVKVQPADPGPTAPGPSDRPVTPTDPGPSDDGTDEEDDEDDGVPGLDDPGVGADEEDDEADGTDEEDDEEDEGISTQGWLIAASAAVVLIAVIALIVWASRGKGPGNGSDNDVDYV